MSDLRATVLSYILPANREGLDQVIQRLTLDHFPDEKGLPHVQRTLFRILVNYGEKYNAIFPGKFLVDILTRSGVEESKILLYTETYNAYAAQSVDEDAFKYAIDGLIEDYNGLRTGQVITAAYDILEQGIEVDGESLRGWKAASEYATMHLSEIGFADDSKAPEGDMRAEGDKLIADYESTESQEVVAGIQTGLSMIDANTGGLQPAELCILAAFTSQGKSQLTAQLAWHASVIQGKGVYFATTETIRNTTMRRILARHSRLPQFGIPNGLNVNDIKKGTLTPDEKAIFFDVVKDFTTNSNYATCYIAQMPRNATLEYLNRSVTRVNKQVAEIELVCVDYLQLFKAERSRLNEREEFNQLLRESKVWCSTFANRGVPFITPWQMRPQEYKDAVKAGAYTLASLADTSESEKSADIIISLLRPTPDSTEGLIQILKNRDGPLLAPTAVKLDYRNSYVGEIAGGGVTHNSSNALDFNNGEIFDVRGFLNASY